MEVVPSKRDNYADLEVNIPHQAEPRFHNNSEPEAFYASKQLPNAHTGPSWLIFCTVVVVTAVVFGGAVGGGIGVSLSKCNSDLRASQNSTSAASLQTLASTSTNAATSSGTASTSYSTFSTTVSGQLLNYKAEPTNAVYNLLTDCASLGSQMRPPQGGTFDLYCDKDINSGKLAAETGSAGQSLYVLDILGTITYSLMDCLQNCAVYNQKQEAWGNIDRCRSITFRDSMASSIAADGASCWIKNGTLADAGDMIGIDGAVGAMLVANGA